MDFQQESALLAEEVKQGQGSHPERYSLPIGRTLSPVS